MEWWRSQFAATSVVRVFRVRNRDLLDDIQEDLHGTVFPPDWEGLTKRTHPFYIAPLTEYPLLLGFSLFGIMVGNVTYLHTGALDGGWEVALVVAASAILCWIRDLEKMAASPAIYTPTVRRNLLCGVLLFIVSEVMVFFALFWAYFHSALNPTPALGAVWPPAGLGVLEWYKWPLLSTALLVFSGFAANTSFYALKELSLREMFSSLRSSTLWAPWPFPVAPLEQTLFGVTLTAEDWLTEQERIFQTHQVGDWFHPWYYFLPTISLRQVRLRCYRLRIRLFTLYGGLVYTIFAGALFLCCQKHEYGHTSFNMADGNYPTLFFGLTGLHGLHVMAGLGLLGLALWRFYRDRFLGDNVPHVGMTAAVWYWHFVDVVWILLFGVVYVWGNSRGTPTPLPDFSPEHQTLYLLDQAYSSPLTPKKASLV
jgi:heme/copper-type cytochrome/quinol oxidase subunit 3